MAQRTATLRHGAVNVAWWMIVAFAAVAAGAMSQRSSRLLIALIATGCIGWLVLQQNVRMLVPLTLLALAWGSSILPGASAAFIGKFALIAAVALTGGLILVSPRSDDHFPVPTKFAVASFAVLFVALASSLWSIDAGGTVQKAISMLLVWAATAIAIPLWVRRRGDIADLLLGSGLVAAGFTALGLVLGLAHIISGFVDSGRFNGLLNDANALGFWVAPILPPLVLMAARTPAGRRRRLLIISIVVLAIGVALTGSRGAALASGLGVMAGFLAAGLTGQRREARRAVLLVLLALLAAVVVFPALGLHTRSAQGTNEGFFQIGNGSNRSPAWSTAVRVASEDPILGHGFGTTPVLFPATQSLTQQAQILGRTHNSYLEAAIDLGWTGMIALIALALSGALAAWRVARGRGPYQVIGTILLAGVVGGMVEGVFESGLLAAGGLLAFPFWMAVALAHSVRMQQRRESQLAATISA